MWSTEFGAILQLGGASSYKKVNGSLLLKDLDVIKLILMAIAVGTVGIYALDLVDMANLSIKPTYVVGIVIAGLIFGALGVSGLWVAIPFSAILFVLMFKVLKDRYE